MKITTRHVPEREYERELLVDGVVRFRIEREPIPTNSHFAIWSIVGRLGHFPTLRDLKAAIPRILAENGKP